ncbi:MAG: SDR family oxidoreductase [Chloroflexota bacterium]
MDLSGQNVLITGGSRGIGRATAVKCATAGAQVAIHYNQNKGAAEETLEMLDGTGHLIVQAHLGDAAAVKNMVDEAAKHFDGLDTLVNNAGVFFDHPVADVDYDTWQTAWHETLQVNLVGAANACYCAAQYMIKAQSGRIINVSSRGAYRGEPESPAYGASKAGMNAMSQSLAKYLGAYNIFVTAVAPGFVETEMATEVLASSKGDEIRNQSPLKRVATPDEVAQVILFLAAPGSEWVTGGVIDVNGASYLR